jgi:glycosyltransferase involved in cell wall biosynthesis
VLVFHPALAPYRVDMWNALHRACDLRLVFLMENVPYQAFDQAKLRAMLEFEPGYLLSGIAIGEGARRRTLRLGFGAEIARHRPEVVVTSEYGPASASVVALRALRRAEYAWVLATEDNRFAVEHDTLLHALGRRALLPRADCVLTYSDEAAAFLRERFGTRQPVAASALVQDEAVVRARIDRAGAAAAEAARAHGLAGRKVLLCVGRLAPEKRTHLLVDAALRLQRSRPEVVLALVGDGPARAELEARAGAAARDGRVVFTGRLEGDALLAWYRLGAVLALASDYEPFGAVVNEALIAGLPAVVSDRAGARVLVAPGRNGEVVDAADPAALDAALARWLDAAAHVPAAGAPPVRPPAVASRFEDAVRSYLGALEAAIAHRRGRAGVGR